MKARVALTIAGSDSGGGAGIQADLKTFHSLGVFGTSAITVITCQNPRRVSAVQPVRPEIVTEQMERVFEAFPVAAAKTGMLYDAGIIRAVAAGMRARRLVVDPVMVATSGARLLRADALAALQDKLLPLATVVTPNRAEAEVLWGRPIQTVADARAAARALSTRYGVAFLVKGGHLQGTDRAVDILFDGRRSHEFSAARMTGVSLHGTGCTLSAALAAHLALGCGLAEATRRAKQFVTRAIRNALTVGSFRTLNL